MLCRIISHFGGGKRSVLYKAPCGRTLRKMEEVHMYLRITKSQMTVDLFDFDYWVNCLAEFSIEKYNIHIPVRIPAVDVVMECMFCLIRTWAPCYRMLLKERRPFRLVASTISITVCPSSRVTLLNESPAKTSVWIWIQNFFAVATAPMTVRYQRFMNSIYKRECEDRKRICMY